MRPVKTLGSNHNFGPPPGKGGEIGDLPCQLVLHGDGTTTVYSVWQLSDEDRKAIANGYNLRLGVVWIGGFPPVSLGVTHEVPLLDLDEEAKAILDPPAA